MSAVYETFYRLTSDPFRLSPDYRFCYAHPSYRKAKAYMQYALQRGEGFLVVTGTPGTGKTTLIEDVCARIDPARVTLVSLLSTRVQRADLLDMIAAGLGIAGDETGNTVLRDRIEAVLLRLRRLRRRVVLMVDEAQDLSAAVVEELRSLSDLQLNGRQLVQVFLVGQDPLVELIKQPEMELVRQRIVAAAHLRPLSPAESADFVIHRLRRVGWQHDPRFTPQALASVYRFSRGVPRLINQLCSRLLFFGAVEGRHTLDGGDVDEVIDGLREEMQFGAAVSKPAADRRGRVPERAPVQTGQPRADPARPKVPLRPSPSQDRQVAFVAAPAIRPLSNPVPVWRDEPALAPESVAVPGSPTVVGEGRRAPPRSARPQEWAVRPWWRQASFAVLLLGFAATGYQLRIAGNVAEPEPDSYRSEDMAAFTVLPVPGASASASVEAQTAPQDDTADPLPAPVAGTVLSGASGSSASPASDQVRHALQAVPDARPAAQQPAAVPGKVVETVRAGEPAIRAHDPTGQPMQLASGLATGPGKAGGPVVDLASRRYQPQEVRALLMSGQWTRQGRPTDRLPSTVTRCRSRPDHILCWSAPQKVAAGAQAGIYQVQASIEGFSSEGTFKIRYQVMQSVLRAEDPGAPALVRTKRVSGPAASARKTLCTAVDSTLIRCGGEVDAVFRLGWTVAGQDTTCRAIDSARIRCRGDVEGIFRLGSKLSVAEMSCSTVDSSRIRCQDGEGGVHTYRNTG